MGAIQKKVRERAIQEGEENTALNREVVPVLDEVRSEVNRISGNTKTVTADYTMILSDGVILADSSSTINVTLPSALDAKDYEVTVKRIGTGSVVVNPSGSDTIDGFSSYTITVQWKARRFTSDGSDWYIIAGVF